MNYPHCLQIRPLSETQKAYLAGIIDGEGCITVTKKRGPKSGRLGYCYRPVVHVANTHEGVLKTLHLWTGLGRVNKFDDARKNRKARFQWFIWSNQAKQIILAIRPYLVIKTDQAKVFLKFVEVANHSSSPGPRGLTDAEWEKQHELYLKIRELNKRGP